MQNSITAEMTWAKPNANWQTIQRSCFCLTSIDYKIKPMPLALVLEGSEAGTAKRKIYRINLQREQLYFYSDSNRRGS
jgi:hypothetical protein